MDNIILATDHAGYELKEKVKKHLERKGYNVEDMGASSYDPEDDYPDFITPAAEKVAANEEHKGIIFGGSGQGEAMAANRIKGARAAVYYGGDNKVVVASRSHNDANILSLGARFLDEKEAFNAVDVWLEATSNNEERHIRRIRKLDR